MLLKSLKQVIENLSSKHGIISSDVKNNSLIICDTKENLERILAQIHRADKTTQQKMPKLFVETVMLKFLDASKLKAAIAKMSSEYGSISFDTKSNSLIICDTKENLQRIIAQVRNSDKTPEKREWLVPSCSLIVFLPYLTNNII